MATGAQRFRRTVSATFALFVAAVFVQAGIVFLPKHEEPTAVDVAVVLSPHFNRFDTAIALVEAGRADALAISTPSHRGPPAECAVNELSMIDRSIPVICFAPTPVTTQGEAMSFAAAADAFGWDSAAVVTERTHLNRARLYFQSCAPGLQYEFVIAPIERTFEEQLAWLVYETGAWAKAASVGICGGTS